MDTKKIALDAGHGLKTPGKQTPTGIKEWTLNDKVADKVEDILADYDVEIIRTDNDEGIIDESLTERLQRYLKAGVDAFVSLHHNAYTSKWNNATGVEVWVDRNCTAADLNLANAIYDRLVKYTSLKGRGIKRENFAVINQNKIPAVLCEGGFMDGTSDYKYITSDEGILAYAKAVAEGLIAYLGLEKKKKTSTKKTTTKKKSVATLAQEVLDGKWGDNPARKRRLTEAGYDYAAVQKKVNELASKKTKKTTTTKKKSITTIAKEVIDGKWGNGLTRKSKLKKAGYDYNAVQKEVNRLLK